MMNLIELQPGEGIYVGADGVHAWLDGRELTGCLYRFNLLDMRY
jgi:mannose-6-phosphate isomerase class I